MEVRTKEILYWFIKGQIQFDMPEVLKMSLALNEPIGCSSVNANTTSKHGPRVEEMVDIVCKTANAKS